MLLCGKSLLAFLFFVSFALAFIFNFTEILSCYYFLYTTDVYLISSCVLLPGSSSLPMSSVPLSFMSFALAFNFTVVVSCYYYLDTTDVCICGSCVLVCGKSLLVLIWIEDLVSCSIGRDLCFDQMSCNNGKDIHKKWLQ